MGPQPTLKDILEEIQRLQVQIVALDQKLDKVGQEVHRVKSGVDDIKIRIARI